MENIEVPELLFDEENHVYMVDGVKIPSVTEILKPLSQIKYGQINESVLMKAAQRGTDVHAAIETWMKYRFDDISSDLSMYYYAFKLWWEQNDVEPIYSEMQLYSRSLRYAGTIDCVAKVNGEITLIDFKTTATINDTTCAPQLEAYSKMLEEHGIIVQKKMILHVKKDGTFKAKEYPNHDIIAWRVFTSLKYVHDYLQK